VMNQTLLTVFLSSGDGVSDPTPACLGGVRTRPPRPTLHGAHGRTASFALE
jgi:hypothetical protein